MGKLLPSKEPVERDYQVWKNSVAFNHHTGKRIEREYLYALVTASSKQQAQKIVSERWPHLELTITVKPERNLAQEQQDAIDAGAVVYDRL